MRVGVGAEAGENFAGSSARLTSKGVRTDPFPTYDAEEDIRRALDAGARGYRLEDSSQDDLIMPRSRTGGILANRSGDNASTAATLVNVWAEIRPALPKSSTTASGMDHFVTRADWHRWG